MLTIPLPDVAVAATSTPEVVYCAAGGRILVLDGSGTVVADYAAPAAVTSLAAAGNALVAIVDHGVVAWLDPASGEVQARLPVGGEPTVVAGNGGLWVHEVIAGRAWPLADDGVRGPPVTLGAAVRVAVDGAQLWWTTPAGALHRSAGDPVELDASGGPLGGIVACSGSIWVSADGALLAVNAWSGAAGPVFAAPEGPVDHLACGAGVLVGGSGRNGLFVLDPSVDADLRRLDVDLGGDVNHLVATRRVAFAFPADRAEARVVPIRPTA